MKPAEICNTLLGRQRLTQILNGLSSPQIKATLKQGELKVKLPGGYVSQQKRRNIWMDRILASLEQGNEELASELLQQWLLHHRRELLIAFLNGLEVNHRQGETDESFLITRPADRIREQASQLLKDNDPFETAAYLHYIAYQQRANVFDDWQPLTPETLTAAEAAAPAAEEKPAD